MKLIIIILIVIASGYLVMNIKFLIEFHIWRNGMTGEDRDTMSSNIDTLWISIISTAISVGSLIMNLIFYP